MTNSPEATLGCCSKIKDTGISQPVRQTEFRCLRERKPSARGYMTTVYMSIVIQAVGSKDDNGIGPGDVDAQGCRHDMPAVHGDAEARILTVPSAGACNGREETLRSWYPIHPSIKKRGLNNSNKSWHK